MKKYNRMKKYGKFLTILCTVLALATVGVVAYMLYYLYNSYSADKSAEELMSQFENDYVEDTTVIEEPKEPEETINEQVNETSTNTTTNTNTNTNTTKKPTTNTSYNVGTYYKGYKIVGMISIPALNIQYPIFNVDNTTTLRVGTATIYPLDAEQTLNKKGNVVIAGHNYRNSRMFSKLNTLKNGDSIFITNVNGTKLEYKVYNNYTADVNDFAYATRNTDDSIEISLTTCTNNESTRTVIWAKAE